MTNKENDKMHIVTAVMRHETNTFSPVPTPLEAFGRGAAGGPKSGEAAVQSYRGTNNPAAAFIKAASVVSSSRPVCIVDLL